MQLTNKAILTIAAMSAFVTVAQGHSYFPRAMPGDSVNVEGELVKRNGGDNPTNNTVEVRLPDNNTLPITNPAPIAEEFAKHNRDWAPVHFRNVKHAPRAVIVTCMDGRIFTEKPLGMKQGDVLVVRNAGGRAPDSVRSIVIAQQMLGATEIAIYHHTDCGLGAYTDEDIEAKVTKNFGRQVETWADMAWYTFKEDGLYQSLVSDVNYLKLHPLINATVISGWIYNVTDGLVQRVV